LFYNTFITCLYMFRVPYAHQQEVKILLYSLWYHRTYRWPSRAQVERGLKLVNYQDKYTEIYGQQNIKKYTVSNFDL